MKQKKYVILLCLLCVVCFLVFCACTKKNQSFSSDSHSVERETDESCFWNSSSVNDFDNRESSWSDSFTSEVEASSSCDLDNSSENSSETSPSSESSGNSAESSSAEDQKLHLSHNYAPAGNKASTCEEQGENYFKCTVCDFEKTEYIPAKGHTTQKTTGYAPTCENEGLSDGSICSVCDEVLTAQTSIPTVDHDIDSYYFVCKWCNFFDVSCLNFEKWNGAYQCTGFAKGAGFVRWLTIPDTFEGLPIVGIKAGSFKEHREFVSVELGVNLRFIGENAFLNCENLVEIYDRSTEKVSEKASAECGYLTQYARRIQVGEFVGFKSWVEKNDDGYIIYDENGDGVGEKVFVGYDGKETALTLPEGITTINGYAFAACNTLRSVTLPKSLTLIEPHAFYETPLLEKIIFQESNGWQRRAGKSGNWEKYEGVFDNPTLARETLGGTNYYYYKREV